MGAKDQTKLDEYFTGVREIENRLSRVEKMNTDASLTAKAPSGVPPEFDAHIRLMFDMMTLAYQADLTRVCTFMICNDGSNRNYKDVGVSEGHHDMSHHGGDAYKQAQVAKINKYHADQVAYFLNKLGQHPRAERYVAGQLDDYVRRGASATATATTTTICLFCWQAAAQAH